MPRWWVVLLAVVLLLVPARRESCAAQEISLGPPVTREDVGLTVRAEIGPAQAIEGFDGAGFVPLQGAAFFLGLDVRGARGNKNGFGLAEFVPYLTVMYTLTSTAGGAPVYGRLPPLVGRQGLRYGNNVVVPGSGRYTLTVTIDSPLKTGFGRHTDMETGVRRWWAPWQVEWGLDASRLARP